MTSTNERQEWHQELLAKYGAPVAHTFILHGAVGDYVAGQQTLGESLKKLFAKWNCIAFYNLSDGWRFPLKEHREAAEKVLEAAAGAGGEMEQEDPLLAALTAQAGGDETFPTDPAAALDVMDILLHSDEETKVCLVVEKAETVWPNANVAQMQVAERRNLVRLQNWAADNGIGNGYNLVILVTSEASRLHEDVRGANSRVETIRIPLPGLDRRRSFIEYLVVQAEADGKLLKLEDGFTVDGFAMSTAALQLVHIEDIVLRAQADGGILTRSLVKTRKAEVVSSEFADVVKMVDPAFGFEQIGGLDHLKEFFLNSIIEPMHAGNCARVPKAVLMTGPAGTGKSVFAEAVAMESGMNCMILDPGKMKGSLVGESEARTEKTFAAIEALAPVIVFLDEVDQHMRRGEGGRSGDSGVSDYIFGRMLEYLADDRHRGKVTFLLATNRPDMLDPAFKRAGRCDKIVAFLPPTPEERVAIFEVLMENKYGIKFALDVDLKQAAIETEGWTGAEIDAVCRKAIEVAQDDGHAAVYQEHLERALWAIIPNTRAVDWMTKLALLEVNDRELLPPQHAKAAADKTALQDEADRLAPSTRRQRREV